MYFRSPGLIAGHNIVHYAVRRNDLRHYHSRLGYQHIAAVVPIQYQQRTVACCCREVNHISEIVEVERVVINRSPALSTCECLAKCFNETRCAIQCRFHFRRADARCIYFNYTAVSSPFYEICLSEGDITRRNQSQLFYATREQSPIRIAGIVTQTQRTGIVGALDSLFGILRIRDTGVGLR